MKETMKDICYGILLFNQKDDNGKFWQAICLE